MPGAIMPNTGLNLEIDVVGVKIVPRAAGLRRQNAFANVGQAGVVGVPDLGDLGVPFVGDGDGLDVDAIAAQAVEEQQIDVDVVVVRRAKAGILFFRGLNELPILVHLLIVGFVGDWFVAVGLVCEARAVRFHARRGKSPISDVEADGRAQVFEFPGLVKGDADHFAHPGALNLVDVRVPVEFAKTRWRGRLRCSARNTEARQKQKNCKDAFHF